ncbi:DsrE family protein [Lentilactobacillus sp. Marseille-Q4993]|uniref:DsrE family protein n=1 Tax=Lentilactobacillus sp. Marseille-Q4993 TaxID=3039492 RepID=UPI0024BC500D|nr:DsrE family protein [Lentilactobacillus sp. Marseille-Q4993]
MNTIFHIDEPTKWPMIFSNVPHMHEWMIANNDPGKIEVLVNGEAITKTTQSSDIDLNQLIKLGVEVAVCNNSMNQRNITKDDLQPGLTIVPVGVVELAQKQQQGYSYIRP